MGKYITKIEGEYYEFDSFEDYQNYMNRKWFVETMARNAEEEKKKKEKAAKKARAAAEEAENKRKIRLEEKNRVETLKEYCREKHLDFDTENRKYVKKKAAQKTVGTIISVLGALAILFSIVTFTGWEIFDAFSLGTWLISGIAGIVVFFIGAGSIPQVPEDFYDQIKKK